MKLSIVSIAAVLTLVSTNYPPHTAQADKVDVKIKLDNVYQKQVEKFPDRTTEYNAAKQLDETKRLEAIRVAEAQRVAQTPAVAQSVPTVAQSDIQGIITKWAVHYGVDPSRLIRVARCESGFNPLASNKGYYAGGGNPSGLFQFLPQTFSANARRAGIAGDIWNADDSAHVAAYMFSIGQSGQWACK